MSSVSALNGQAHDVARRMSGSVIPLKYLFERSKVSGTGTEDLLSLYRDFGVVPKSSRDDNFNRPSDDLTKYQVVEPGHLVVNKMKAWQGSVAISNHRGIVSPAYFVYRPQMGTPTRYLHYLLRSDTYRQVFGSISYGVRPNQWDLDPDVFGRLPIAVPPRGVARAIVDYLDHEIAEIDALIDEQDRLLNLLSERSTSLVEKVTTQGLGDWSLSRTDLEWPSEVPSHWNVQRTSWLFGSVGSGTTPRSDDVNAFIGDIPWVTSSELREKGISETDHHLSEGALSRYSSLHRYPAGSILIAMYGATIGRLGWLEVPATVNQAVCVFSHYEPGPSRFAYYGLLAARRHLLTLASGGGQPNINQEKLRSLRLPVPPPSEQQEIVEYLKEAQKTTVDMELEAAKLIDVARERRAALISAAVTGQIDVTKRHKPVAEQLEDEVRERV